MGFGSGIGCLKGCFIVMTGEQDLCERLKEAYKSMGSEKHIEISEKMFLGSAGS